MIKKILKVFVIILLFVLAIFLYAKYVGTSGFITKEYSLEHSDLPNSFDGLKIVHFSDLHYGRAINDDKVTEIINEINIINADIVVFTGDLIDKDVKINDDQYDFLTKLFNDINAKYGKYAILGNHDFYNVDKVVKLFNDSGFKYLENDYDVIMNRNGDQIFISGIGNSSHNLDDVDKAMKYSLDNDITYKITLTHEPDVADVLANNYSSSLILGGHSHNGQFRLPIIGAIYTPSGAKKYYDNYYKINNSDLYISSGIGVSSINLRFFNKPSINFYRINKKMD